MDVGLLSRLIGALFCLPYFGLTLAKRGKCMKGERQRLWDPPKAQASMSSEAVSASMLGHHTEFGLMLVCFESVPSIRWCVDVPAGRVIGFRSVRLWCGFVGMPCLGYILFSLDRRASVPLVPTSLLHSMSCLDSSVAVHALDGDRLNARLWWARSVCAHGLGL
jgi:hypothetical protein